MAWFVDEKATPMYQLLEAAFLIAVVACLVYATARVRKGPSELLLQRIGFLIAVSACILLATVFKVLEFQGMVVNLFFYAWFALLFFGVLYFVTRGDQRDFLLHCGVGIWFGLTAAGLAYFALQMLQIISEQPNASGRRWWPGAAEPEFVGYAGFLGGIFVAMRLWNRANRRTNSNPPNPNN